LTGEWRTDECEAVSTENLSALQRRVVKNAEATTGLLWIGCGIALGAVLAKLFGGNEIEVQGVMVNLNHVWIVFFAFTVAHWFLGWSLGQSIRQLQQTSTREQGLQVWCYLKGEGNVFVRNMLPRRRAPWGVKLPGFEINRRDPAGWVASAAVLLLAAASVPFCLACLRSSILLSLIPQITLFLAIVNWVIGGMWITRLSGLVMESH
jgi:hypothetical protein